MQRQALMRVLLKVSDKRMTTPRSEADLIYSPIEDWWLDAVQAFKEVNNIRYPKHTDYLWIAIKLGAFDKMDMTIEAMLKRAMLFKDKG